MQVAPVKQDSFVIAHCLTVFSPEWELGRDSLRDKVGSCVGDSAAPIVSGTGPTAFPDIHHTLQSHHQGDVREASRLW